MRTYDTQNFRMSQLRYLGVALDRITDPLFRPDGYTPAALAGLVGRYSVALTELMAKQQAIDEARGDLASKHDQVHRAVIGVYACMKSCYRNDPKLLASIIRLPKADRAPAQTLVRVKATCARWATLPPPPGSAGPLKVGTLTQAGLTTLCGELEARMNAVPGPDGDEGEAIAGIRLVDLEAEKLMAGALVQGRAHYAEGSPARAYIDAIPTEPSAQAPAVVSIGLAESQAEGAAHLQFDAEHATSFEVWHKGPADGQFALVADVLRASAGQPGEYLGSGLPAGVHQYQVVGVNSRGKGSPSDIAPVAVAVAAVQVA